MQYLGGKSKIARSLAKFLLSQMSCETTFVDMFCDIPYKNTTGYDVKFDHGEFWEWAHEASLKHRVYVSEYSGNTPENWIVVWSIASKKNMRDKSGKLAITNEILVTKKIANQQ